MKSAGNWVAPLASLESFARDDLFAKMFGRKKKPSRPQEGQKKNDLSTLVLYIVFIVKGEFFDDQIIKHGHVHVCVHIIGKNSSGFRSDTSFYCYSSVSYGQELTTLIRQC